MHAPWRLVRLVWVALLLSMVLLAMGDSATAPSNASTSDFEVTLRVHSQHGFAGSELTSKLADIVCNALVDRDADAGVPDFAQPPARLTPTAAGSPPVPEAAPEGLRVELVPGMYLGSKTPYSPAESLDALEVMPPHCHLVHLGHVGRHGSRHGTRLREAVHVHDSLLQAASGGRRPQSGGTPAAAAAASFPTAAAAAAAASAGVPAAPPPSLLTVLGDEALRWIEDHMRRELPVLGELTRGGVKELFQLAERLWQRHGPALAAAMLEHEPRGAVFESTDKKRAMDSRDAFIQGLAHAGRVTLTLTPPAPPLTKHARSKRAAEEFQPRIFSRAGGGVVGVVVRPPVCVADPQANYKYTALRFFDTCASFSLYKKGKMWQTVTAPYTANASKSTSHERAFLNQLFAPTFTDSVARAGIWSSSGPPSPDWPGASKAERVPIADLVSDIQSVCTAQIAAFANPFQFCSLFERANHMELMRKLELLQDLGDYYKKGIGDPNAFAMSCTLLEDIITTADIGAGIADPARAPPQPPAALHPSKKAKRSHGKASARTRLTAVGDTAALSESDWERMHDPSTDHRDAPPSADYAEALLSDIESAEETSAEQRAERRHGTPVANFRFAHAETVMPLTSLLGIFDSEQTLEQLYLSQLAAGTSSLLDTMRRALSELRATYGSGCSPRNSAGGMVSVNACAASDQIWTDILATGHVPADVLAVLKHPWSTSRISPMATNLQLEVYDCGDEAAPRSTTTVDETTPPLPGAAAAGDMYGTWARLLHNEKEVHFPPCAPPHAGTAPGAEEAGLPDADRAMRVEWRWRKGLAAYNSTHGAISGAYGINYACPWDLAKRYYRDFVYGEHGITNCDAQDWGRVCGGVEVCSDNLS